ncbi:MAG: hypothetical protein JXE06_01130 [Coriobacteriia bacterium]|nr:hypothetical protein [Coriobacteriia bacterium]MBN2822463.1 hypothetical protein [Coriobacteriia bacterium]
MTSKKLAIVLVLACAFTMMFAGTALAVAGVDGDQYSAWGTTGANATVQTPHAGYGTTTVKCAVCHAVHRATAGGEVLLRGTVANACEYCHITNSVSSVKVYDSVAANYTTDYENNHYAGSGSTCVDCHTVHGAGAISTTAAGDINTKILKSAIGGQSGTVTAAETTYDFTTGTDRNGVVTAFCSQCHTYWANDYDDDATANMHIMGDATANYANSKATIAANSTVAWAPSTYCRSCHDAGETDGASAADNFPHYTSGNRFLLSAVNFASVGSATGAADPSEDGACLKCHRADASTGVGLDF